MKKQISEILSDFKKPFNHLLNWYFTKKALPYWSVLLLDCVICFISGIFVLLLFTSVTEILRHWQMASLTILLYMCLDGLTDHFALYVL